MRHIHMQSLVASVVLTLMSWAVAAGAEMQEFLISYWGGPPVEETTLERYREIAECGFNVVMPPANDADVPTNLKILDLCAELGLKAIIADNRMPEAAGELSDEKKQALDAMVADYSNHPALAGYFIRDEPPTRMLPAVAAIHRYLLEKDPQHLPFVNLYPNYARPARFDGKGYDDHVAQFIELVQPQLVSWDHYKQMAGDESLYFLNLNTIRQQCLKVDLPYIQIILALPHWSYRNPSEADLRWQVYTSLAYGVRGIMYFTYWTWPAWKLGDGPAIIGPDGRRDVKYDIIQRLNRRLNALGPTLMQLTSTGVYATAPLQPGLQALPAEGLITQATGGPLLIGCFVNQQNERYILVVNRSFEESCTAEVTVPDVVSAAEISQETGQPLPPAPGVDGALSLTLEPGEGRLLRLNRP